MPKVTNFTQANAALAHFVPNAQLRGSYSLERMRELMSFLGNPQNNLKVIHVAGTSGKTSTSYYAAALLQAAGYKVGLTVSPHVTEVNERVQIDGQPLPESVFCHELTEFLPLIEESELNPTYFEVLVAFAYWEFAKRAVDYAVVEVGLGGLLDGTNVVDRTDKVCVITDIGLDHINILGGTLPEIAAKKAGIIQPGNEVFCHEQPTEVIEVFKKYVEVQKAKLHIIKSDTSSKPPDFLPLFQQRNFALAEAAVDFVLERYKQPKLTQLQITIAAHALIPARMEIFHHDNKTIILDGAHNAQKLQALAESIRAKYPGQAVAALISFVDGRSYRLHDSLLALASLSEHIIITAFHSGHDLPYGAVKPSDLAELAKQQGFVTMDIVDEPSEALHKLLARPEPVLLITGSFFLMNDVRGLVQKL